MERVDLIALLPIVIMGTTSVVVMIVTAFCRRYGLTTGLALAGEVIALASISLASSYAPRQVTPLLIVDRYGLLLTAILLTAGIAVLALSHGYLRTMPGNREEFHLMLLLATLGSIVLVSSSHFASFFVGLEILSVSLYVLIAYPMRNRSLEAGLKYLILAGASSAILLFGIALEYAALGTMSFKQMAANATGPSVLLLAGFALILSGLGFKLALVPFHMWTPDIYEGAPAPVTAFIATVSKGAVFGFLLRYFTSMHGYTEGSLFVILTAVSIASMAIGNLLALMQNNVKRILAYSSIAHLGYLLVAFLSSGDSGVSASIFYLVSYFIGVMTTFGIVTLLSRVERDADGIEDYRGLFWRRPWLAAAFTASLFSLAGIPLTVGFVGKFYLLAAGVGSALWLLVVVLVITSVIGLFYYLRIIVALYSPVPSETGAKVLPLSPAMAWLGGLVVAALMILLVWFGIYPSTILQALQQTLL
jgi:NADH-quinone oxidoreductase subunit N